MSIRELRQQLKHYVETAERGEDVTITDHGRPIARLVPIREERTIDRLIREGLATPPSRSKDDVHWERIRSNGSVSDLIDRSR